MTRLRAEKIRALEGVLLGVLLAGVAPAQTQPAAPAYDVASIKPSAPDQNGFDFDIDEGTLHANHVSLKILMEEAYGIKRDLIFDLPDWAVSARFDIQAKSLETDPEVLKNLSKQYRPMLRKLLEERFGVKTHMETKILPVYELVTTKGGIRFAKTSATEDHASMKNSGNELTATDIPMADMVDFLTNQLHRTVFDKTNLTGRYDLRLHWSRDDESARFRDNGRPVTEDAPQLFTALEEQLGLKLQPDRGPVPTLVVDRVEQPTEN